MKITVDNVFCYVNDLQNRIKSEILVDIKKKSTSRVHSQKQNLIVETSIDQ